MRFTLALISVLFVSTNSFAADNGLITKKSKNSADQTISKLEKILRKKGMTIFARVSHTKGASGVKIPLRKTELLIFGNPKLGSHLMTSNQTAGIDLPMKALAWKDAKGQVWLTYNDPAYLASRHGIKDRAKVVKKMTGALKKFTDAASQ